MNLIEKCRKALELLELDNIPVIFDEFCYYNVTRNFIAMNALDACSQKDEWYTMANTLLSNAEDYSLILWSLLHEYGHYQDAMETYSDEEDAFFRELMLMMPDGSEKVLAYFNLPSERVASAWAADFIRENAEKCKEVDRLLFWDYSCYLTNR